MSHTDRTPTRPPARLAHRRGAGIAVVILLLALVQMTAISAVGGSADESDAAVTRVLTTRAFYAAEAAATVAVHAVRTGLDLPAAGEALAIGTATAVFVSAPAPGEPGDIRVEGRADRCVRRVRVTLDEE